MKNLLTALLAATALLGFVACDDDEGKINPVGIDPNAAVPTKVTLIKVDATSISITCDIKEAALDHATAVEAMLMPVKDGEESPTYDYSNRTQKLISGDATDDNFDPVVNFAFSKLKKGSQYRVRVRCLWPKSRYSAWAYLCKDDGITPETIILQ